MSAIRLQLISAALLGLAGLSVAHAEPATSPAASGPVHVLKKAPATQPANAKTEPLVYWNEVWTEPRPVQLHFLKIDLTNPAYEVVTVLGEDPDGAGPDEATLRPPMQLAKKHKLVAAVNANGFWHSSTLTAEEKKRGWRAGEPVTVLGLVISDGKMRSEADPRRIPLWIDAAGRAHVGDPKDDEHPRQAIANFEGPLLADGRITVKGKDTPYPRTVVGIDKDGRWLLMLMAEGRQKGRSEGLTLRDAARVMIEHGCSDAINLDGGGSSVMLANTSGHLQVMNHAPNGYLRPLPMLLGVRPREAHSR